MIVYVVLAIGNDDERLTTVCSVHEFHSDAEAAAKFYEAANRNIYCAVEPRVLNEMWAV